MSILAPARTRRVNRCSCGANKIKVGGGVLVCEHCDLGRCESSVSQIDLVRAIQMGPEGMSVPWSVDCPSCVGIVVTLPDATEGGAGDET